MHLYSSLYMQYFRFFIKRECVCVCANIKNKHVIIFITYVSYEKFQIKA